MEAPKKQLTAEEICRKREQTQKKKDKKKESKRREISAQAAIVSPGSPEKRDTILNNHSTTGGWAKRVPAEPKNASPDCDWMTSVESPIKLNVEEANVGWPWVGAPCKLVTQAPYAANEYNSETSFFTLPQEVQVSPLFNIPRGMEAPILQILFQYHSCASKFAATCQSAFNLVATNIHHWDFSRCQYNDCDNDFKSHTSSLASVGKIVVVSQFRVRKWRGEHFECEMYSLQRMTHAFVNFADRFEILHLHRIPFLTTHLLELVVPMMTKLKVLGVYRCELLHIGDTLKLLEIIRKERNYGNGKIHKVDLDFYPRFHVGPVNNPIHVGKSSFGVTWDNFGLDSRLGIWQLLTGILPQAKKQCVDLIGKDSALRFWLEQSPCWRVDETIATIERGDDGVDLAVQVNYPNSRGKADRTISDKNHRPITKFGCRDCNQSMLGIFFDYEEYSQLAWGNSNYEMLCLGCKLVMHLRFEDDHRKLRKHHMVSAWLGDPEVPVRNGDLEKALTLESKKKGMRYASRYERDRKEHETKKLGEEKQKPRLKHQKCSPSINERECHDYW